MKSQTYKQQTGAALITSLALLLVLTLIGLSAMNTTTLEEKMTGSVYNQQVSFQRAEAALRIGENTAQLVEQNDTPAAGTTGLYDFIDPTNPNYPVWDYSSGKDFDGWYITNTADVEHIPDHDFNPSYVIEYISDYQQNPNCILNTPAAEECDTHTIYRVTARAQGLNDRATSVVQSSYRVRK